LKREAKRGVFAIKNDGLNEGLNRKPWKGGEGKLRKNVLR